MSANPASVSYERLLMLRRPRSLRLKTWTRILGAVYAILSGGVAYGIFLVVKSGEAKAASNSPLNTLSLAMFGVIWLIIGITMFRSMMRDRSLLSDGGIAVATVTSQSFAGDESRESRITYQFKDAAGRTFTGKCKDRTRKVFEEMQTPVFYDPNNPAKNIAVVGATYDLVES